MLADAERFVARMEQYLGKAGAIEISEDGLHCE
jgi:hypothetical protein